MKNVKYVIIAIACICLICGGFYLFAQSKTPSETQLTDVQKVILKDLKKDYPKTPREVVKLYNRIACGYYDSETTDEQVEDLVNQMMYLFDDELAMINPKDKYYQNVLTDIDLYKQQHKSIVNADVCDSNEVLYINDKKEGTDNVDELAYVNTTYFIKTNGQFAYTYQQFVLRKDEDGRWKILTFYEIEGESSDDE